eukprot:3461156-Pleurochrysis_carterae.AAC.1
MASGSFSAPCVKADKASNDLQHHKQRFAAPRDSWRDSCTQLSPRASRFAQLPLSPSAALSGLR